MSGFDCVCVDEEYWLFMFDCTMHALLLFFFGIHFMVHLLLWVFYNGYDNSCSFCIFATTAVLAAAAAAAAAAVVVVAA